jgi:hypothetical protein
MARGDLTTSNEVAWRLYAYRWLPICSEYRKSVGEVHDALYFRLHYSSPTTCYTVDGVGEYGDWFIAEKRLLTITEYNVEYVLSEVSSEPVVKYRVDDVVFKVSGRQYVSIPHDFDVGVIKRIVGVADRINQMPYHHANLVMVDADGYSLQIVKSRPVVKYRPHGNKEFYYVRFNKSGGIVSTGIFNLPITLFI